MEAPLVTLVGGTGFIGRHLARSLAGRGRRVRLVARSLGGAAGLPFEDFVRGDLTDAAAMARVVDGAWAVVNLVGTTAARSEREFYALHRDAPVQLAEAARRAGARRFIQVSAMGVAKEAPAAADRSKAAGEIGVREAFPAANVARPALVYGPGDHFFTRFAALARRAPAIPLIGGGRTRFQPMHVEDVAAAMARMLDDDAFAGRAFDLGAGEVLTFRELIERLCDAVGRRPWLVPIPFALAEAGARVAEWLPNPPMTVDQVRLLKTDKVAREPGGGPAALGIERRPLTEFLDELGRDATD
ncbi:MAG TPA: complex I NDUFA9 subunit family protein [Pelomicrobium sp.]|nr:complex I NDUFA9 subunit family protein [Pelomicrobium sp.]